VTCDWEIIPQPCQGDALPLSYATKLRWAFYMSFHFSQAKPNFDAVLADFPQLKMTRVITLNEVNPIQSKWHFPMRSWLYR